LDGNTNLVEILDSYKGDWKICQKFLNLQKENQGLKESKYKLKKSIEEKIVNQLDSELSKIGKKIERRGSFSESGNTDELTSIAGEVVKNLKGINENLKEELAESKT
jgi:hypothetical protein